MRWNMRLQRAGAVLLVLCGLAHLAGHIMSRGQHGPSSSEMLLLELMNSYRFPEVGRTMQELFDGFSLTFSVMFVALGVLAWSASTRGLVVITVALLCESAIGLLYWFFAPNSFILSATLCFVVSLTLRLRKEPA